MIKGRKSKGIWDLVGWLGLILLIFLLSNLVDPSRLNPDHAKFIFFLGILGTWRYGNAFTHYCRGVYFLHWRFPRMRKKVDAMGEKSMPSQIYLVATSFRIPPLTTYQVYQSIFQEALRTNVPVTVVVSIVEKSDERLIKDALMREAGNESNIRLIIVRARGTGKRDGLSIAFKAISRDMPASDAIVGVVDGDTKLLPNCVRNAVSMFSILPTVGGLTTDEYCIVEGGNIVSEWHTMRFVQRHINMSSMALSKRVLTMTGRLSFFRAEILTHPEFIKDVREDFLEHWRLGRFRFLTGDDKSSWLSLMRLGWDTFYVPDSKTVTVEHPPDDNFYRASKQLMYRWYGNSLRQNFRAVKALGWKRLGPFATYVLYDQRISMWTCLLGLTTSITLGLTVGLEFIIFYFFWILLSRTIVTLTFLVAGHGISPYYPFVLYYNQVMGSIMKIYTMFHMDQQSWTRQKTKLTTKNLPLDTLINKVTSKVMLLASWTYFIGIVALVISYSIT